MIQAQHSFLRRIAARPLATVGSIHLFGVPEDLSAK